MHLISALAAGVKGAENGTATLYQRGTSAKANYYLGDGGFEGTGNVISTGAVIDLDQNGGVVVYVTQLVDVVVKDSDGTTVREFVAGAYDDAIEVRSTSFTGVDYASGASAAGNPVVLGTVLDRWITSAGAVDWNVLFDGSAVTIQAALGGLVGFYFNVKNAAYGATGDGTTDDRQAIQAAIDAAETAGGGIVFFPAGTYHMEDGTPLDVPDDVNLLGCGPSLSILSRDHATADLLTFPDGNTRLQTIRGLRFTDEQSNAGSVVEISNGGRFLFEDCDWISANTDASASDGMVHSTDTNDIWVAFHSCRVAMTNPTGQRLYDDSGVSVDSHLLIVGCEFVAPISRTSALTQARFTRAVGNYYDLSAVDADLLLHDGNTTAGDASLAFSGNHISSPSSGNPYISNAAASYQVAIGGNQLPSSIRPCQVKAAATGFTAVNESAILDRAGRFHAITVDTGVWHCDFINYQTARIVAATATDLSVTANILAGATAELIIWNNSGSPMTFSFDSGFSGVTGVWDGVLASTEIITLHFACLATAGTYLWYLTGIPQEF